MFEVRQCSFLVAVFEVLIFQCSLDVALSLKC